MYSRDGLTKLIEKQRWQIAITFVGSDTQLQQTLLEHMLAAGEFQHARVVAQRLGVADFDPAAAQAALQLAAQGSSETAGAGGSLIMTDGFSQSVHAAALRGFLALPLSADDVVFCDNEDGVRSAMRHFFGRVDDSVEWNDSPQTKSCDRRVVSNDTGAGTETTPKEISSDHGIRGVVGLDVEWKPTTSKIATATGSITATAVASILQIASRHKVFLIDLLALHVRLCCRVWEEREEGVGGGSG